VNKHAVMDGPYRYSLVREWEEGRPRVLFIMLNPSTADDAEDDNTIRRCIGFARRWGFGSLEVVNLFAYRAANPSDLRKVADPIGPENQTHILSAIRRANRVVVAWGNKVRTLPQGDFMVSLLADAVPADVPFFCLGLTEQRQPKHPLLVPGDTPLRRCTVKRDDRGWYVAFVDGEADHADETVYESRGAEAVTAVMPQAQDDAGLETTRVSMREVVHAFLEEEQWQFTEPNARTIRFWLSADHGDLEGRAILEEEYGIFVFYSRLPIRVPKEKRSVATELFMRINWNLSVGNFEMDMDSGRVFFRTSVDVDGDELRLAVVRNLVYTNFRVMDRFIPVILSVIFGQMDPKQALEPSRSVPS
jgi:hypothetical protein